MLDDELITLREELLEFAHLVENMVGNSLKGLGKKDHKMLIDLIEKEEPKANKMEIKIDSMCASLIAQYQPMAKNLRTVLTVFTINNDLERMGDLAVNIAESAQVLIIRPQTKTLIELTDILRMGGLVEEMLGKSLGAFINEDSELAQHVCGKDEAVDTLGDEILQQLINLMASDPSQIENSFHFLRISHSLERIADLSTNISEDVAYMVEGKVIKHHSYKASEEETKK